MYHFIFINEASIEMEPAHSVPQEDAPEDDNAQTQPKDKSKPKTDATDYKRTNRPDDPRSFISKN